MNEVFESEWREPKVKYYLMMFFHDSVEAKIENEQRSYPRNSLIFCSPDHKKGFSFGNKRKPWKQSWAKFNGNLVREMLEGCEIPLFQMLPLSTPQIVEKFLLETYRELTSYSNPDLVILQNIFVIFIREVKRSLLGEKRKGIPQKYLDIRRYLDANFNKHISLEFLSKKFFISTPHLCAKYKQYFGTSILNYIIHLKMKRAVDLLKDNNIGIEQIALKLGYKDIKYFSKHFKKNYKVTPSHFRKIMQ